MSMITSKPISVAAVSLYLILVTVVTDLGAKRVRKRWAAECAVDSDCDCGSCDPITMRCVSDADETYIKETDECFPNDIHGPACGDDSECVGDGKSCTYFYSTCQCPPGEIFDKMKKRCYPLREYSEECKEDVQCHGQNQICDKKQGRCMCDPASVYDPDTGVCVLIKNQGEPCNVEVECANDYEECDLGGTNTCVCETGAVLDTELNCCLPEKSYGEPCEKDIQCTDSLENCNDESGTCDCGSNSLDDGTGNCLPYLNLGEECEISGQCNDGNQECGEDPPGADPTCNCISGAMVVLTDQCVMPAALGESCVAPEQCVAADETCEGSECVCDRSQAAPNANNTDCLPNRNYGEGCEVPGQCADELETCISSTCQCDPAISVDNSGECLPFVQYGDDCALSGQCNAGNQQCDSNSCACLANNVHNPDNNACLPEKALTEQCEANVQCVKNDENMICNGVCECAGGYVDVAGTCKETGNYGDSCDDNLQCIESYTQCSGVGGTCGCMTNYVRGEFECLPVMPYLGDCSERVQCGEGQTCHWNNKICECTWTRKWSGTKCLEDGKMLNQGCEHVIQCGRNTACTGGSCQCSPPGGTYIFNRNCYLTNVRGEYCEEHFDCRYTGGFCAQINGTGVCICGRGYIQDPNSNDCLEVARLGGSCATHPSQCTGSFQECDADTQICVCRSEAVEVNGACLELRLYEEPCIRNEQCTHPNQMCNGNNCTCAAGFSWNDVSACV